MNRRAFMWHKLSESFWFVPAVLTLIAVGVAFGLTEIDDAYKDSFWNTPESFFGAQAAGSRAMLTSIATSMITVAGVVFSITLVALSLASSQFSSRVLNNFMNDRSNQVVLGVFVGIFAYCLVVLRTIRDVEQDVFVPALAVAFAVILAFVGIGFLIYFIHHISVSIQDAHILARIAAETTEAVESLFPDELGEEDPAPGGADPAAADPARTWQPVLSRRTGYITTVDIERLLNFAKGRASVVRMERGVGDFVIQGRVLVSILSSAEASEEDAKELCHVFEVSMRRTVFQDAAFGIRQLVDVAVKALSPGINDTTTAVMCLDYIESVLFRLVLRRIENPYRLDEGELRVIALGPSFESLVSGSFDQIRHNAEGNVAVLARILEALESLGRHTRTRARRRILLHHAEALAENIRRTVTSPFDRGPLEKRVEQVQASLS